ncbi:chemotaxis protein CheD [Fodinisporobacter ferrooxydans]|uniref:Probable chemoreceptor glutamine deamidase CheD n=1 Tax=Fodinisporobacter ferrooxydans TaxID=2901836 RepID=A0ABY4CG45_9BACL|nr:chemotaxis protein CheD [Alicyclobacillaceae bacterium MYW30-H2]
MNVVKVAMADLNISESPDSLRTTGLGSCVGVAIYDPLKKIAGLAHVMLPEAKGSPETPAKYANTAIPLLIRKMLDRGAATNRLVAKLAGGAQMFSFAGANDLMRIGPRNVEAVKLSLRAYKIPVLIEDTGGNCGRTIEFFATDGSLIIRTAKNGLKTI